MKLLDEMVDGHLIALNNGIYTDEGGHTRSAINVLIGGRRPRSGPP